MGSDPEPPPWVAISDATGGVGGRVARRLAESGQSARLIALDGDHATDLPAMEIVEASYGTPAWELEGWVTSLVGVARGEMDVVSDAVLALTGHPPMTFDEFLHRNPESYSHLLPA